MIHGSTRVFAILGDPVAHSLSPAMHNAAFRALGLDAVYVPMRVPASEVPAVMRTLAFAGGGGNVTVPHKETAAAAPACASARVRRLGACNTFWGDGDALHGDNTDVDGVLDALHALEAPAGDWLLLGTGGSARAVAAAAAERGVGLAVRSREAGRAAAFTAFARELGARAAEADGCTVVINSTPLGLHAGDALPLDPATLPRARAALDLVYRRGGTPWVHACTAAGWKAADGRGVLVAQGMAAFRRWFPQHRPPGEIMRHAVDAGLR